MCNQFHQSIFAITTSTMNNFVLVTFVLFSINSSLCSSTDEVIKTINSKKPSWKAGTKSSENNMENLRRRSGFLGIHRNPNHEIETKIHKIGRTFIPESFDAREAWPDCQDVIDNIRDQGNCGSCWAFSSVEVMSDRLCIQTEGATKFEFSPNDVLSCCSFCGNGCDGGYTSSAWEFFDRQGIVTGGDFGTARGCQPYEQSAFYYNTRPECVQSCSNHDYQISYSEDKRYGDGNSFYIIPQNVQQIQMEIMTNGPVVTSYEVYEDFGYYEEGVYQYVYGSKQGNHAVKIIGWGTENEVPYWLIANSWGRAWGNLGGYFKIKRGTNECSIESYVLAGYSGNNGSTGLSVFHVSLLISWSVVLHLYNLWFH